MTTWSLASPMQLFQHPHLPPGVRRVLRTWPGASRPPTQRTPYSRQKALRLAQYDATHSSAPPPALSYCTEERSLSARPARCAPCIRGTRSGGAARAKQRRATGGHVPLRAGVRSAARACGAGVVMWLRGGAAVAGLAVGCRAGVGTTRY